MSTYEACPHGLAHSEPCSACTALWRAHLGGSDDVARFGMTHADLITSAAHWLRTARRHPVVLCDVRCSMVSEQPDVLAFKNTAFSTLVECKSSRADFRRDAKKSFRRAEEVGMGYERYFYAPVGTIAPAELPLGWGLLEPDTRRRVVVVVKSRSFMKRNERDERMLLISAIRRVTENWGRRMFGEIAPALVDGDPHPTATKIIRELRAENTKLRMALRGLPKPRVVHAIDCDLDEDCTCGVGALS